jgi:very-short-patch-repair endonuclease
LPRATGARCVRNPARGVSWTDVAESRECVDNGKVGLVDKPSTPRERARRLRREQTEAERFLWARLRARQLSGAKFRRQCAIGPFIADFCCLEHRLIIELDGGQHACEVEKEKDEARSDFLRKQGYEVLRFWDHEVFGEIELVLQRIADLLAARDAE